MLDARRSVFSPLQDVIGHPLRMGRCAWGILLISTGMGSGQAIETGLAFAWAAPSRRD